VELGVWYLAAGLAVPALTWWGARIMAGRRSQRGHGPAAPVTLEDARSDLEELKHRVDELAAQAARQESYLAGRIRALIAVAEDSTPLRFSLPGDGVPGGVTGDSGPGDGATGGGVPGGGVPGGGGNGGGATGGGGNGDERIMAREPER
jgi:hypothetical protein